MLILSRTVEQSIRIGDNIRITVLGVQGSRVKIGLEAPDSVRILRGELDSFGELLDAEQTQVAATARCGSRDDRRRADAASEPSC